MKTRTLKEKIDIGTVVYLGFEWWQILTENATSLEVLVYRLGVGVGSGFRPMELPQWSVCSNLTLAGDWGHRMLETPEFICEHPATLGEDIYPEKVTNLCVVKRGNLF